MINKEKINKLDFSFSLIFLFNFHKVECKRDQSDTSWGFSKNVFF